MRSGIFFCFFFLFFVLNVFGQFTTLSKHNSFKEPGLFVSQHSNKLKSAAFMKQKLDSIVNYSRSSETEDLKQYTKSEFIYNVSEGNVSMYIVYFWRSGRWDFKYKNQYSYNQNGQLIQCILQEYDSETNQWVDDSKENYFYDTTSKLISAFIYRYDNDSKTWQNETKEEYLYNINGQLVQNLSYVWDSNSEWKLRSKQENSYDNSGNIAEEVYLTNYSSTLGWSPEWKYSYSFDANSRMTKKIYSDYQTSGSKWVEDSKTVWTYDTFGNVIHESDSIVNSDYYEPNSKSDYVYDNNYSMNDLMLPSVIPGILIYFNHKMDNRTHHEWNSTEKVWVNTDKSYTYFSDNIINTIAVSKTKGTNLFWNSKTGILSIGNCTEATEVLFELFDTSGLKIASGNIKDNKSVNLSFLRSGLYIYQLSVDGEWQSGKILKN